MTKQNNENPLKEVKIVRIPSVYPFYLAGLAWVLGTMILPMYKLSSFLLCAVISAAGGWIGTRLFKPEEVQVEQLKEETYASEAVFQAVEEGARMLDELREVHRKIQDVQIGRQIEEIEQVTAEILNTIKKRPNSVGSIRKWMNYYLPTTLKLLNQYERLEEERFKGRNIQESMDKIEKMMGLIVTACHQQLNRLFEGEAMDISSEITVMEGMLASEDLIENEASLKGDYRQ